MAELEPGLYRIQAVSPDESGPELYATHQGSGEEVFIAPKNENPDFAANRQVWEYLHVPGQPGQIRAFGTNDTDQAYFRNNNQSRVTLGELHPISVSYVKDGDRNGRPLYTINGPWRQGVYGAIDWIGVRGTELWVTTRHGVQETGLERYYWAFERV